MGQDAAVTGLVVALFFFALMLGPANPFRELSNVPFEGRGPNPLLQNHVLMAFHPPILYLGYVGFTVPFMFAIAALATVGALWAPGTWLYGAVAIAGIAYAGMQSLPMAMLPDVIAHDAVAHGRGRAGAFGGVWTAGETPETYPTGL